MTPLGSTSYWHKRAQANLARKARLIREHDTPEAFYYRERYAEDSRNEWIPNIVWRPIGTLTRPTSDSPATLRTTTDEEPTRTEA